MRQPFSSLRLVLRSIRGRITLAATALVAITLFVASWLLLQWVEADLLDSAQATLDEALEAQAEQFGLQEEFLLPDEAFGEESFGEESFGQEGFEPEPVEAQAFEGFIDGQNVFIGLFTVHDEGLAFGEMFIEDEPVANLVIEVDTGEIVEIWDIEFDEPLTDPVLVEEIESLAFEVFEVGDGDQFLVGAASLDEIAESVAAVRSALWVIGPGLVVAFALLTWWLVGRALRPVMSITSQVDAISSSSLDRRVPVPDTDDELANLATVMNRMLDRLQRGGERQRQFSADASHELRSPLSTIRAAGEMINTNPKAERTQRLAGDIVAESIRMDELIGDLLDLARLDEDRRLPDREPMDLATLLRAELAAELDRGQLTIVVPPTLPLTGSPRQLRRLVRNLVDNAIRHAESTVAVTAVSLPDAVSGHASDERVVQLMVEDDGAGVATEDRLTIFERFSRLDEARTRDAGGSGLGLALVKAIAESHGGSVSITDSELGGAKFVVTLGG
ncbi:MAG: sensor histidine kinase [Acidimicrobiales bacterium]